MSRDVYRCTEFLNLFQNKMDCLNNVVCAADVVSLSGQRQLRVLSALDGREESKQLDRFHDLTLVPSLPHSSQCCQKPEMESTVAARLQEPTNFVTASSSSSNILSGSRTFHTKFVILTFMFQNTIQEQDETSGCRRGRPLRF